MKRNYIILYLFLLTSLSACVTGGFDENPQLDERNEALAKAPKIEQVLVDGVEVMRNTQSIRVVQAHIGDVIRITANISSGKNAELTELEVSRQYYGEEDPLPLDPASPTGFYELSGNTHVFELDYTVPEKDDDDAAFHDGDVILIYFRAANSLENYGYKAIQLELVH